MCTVTFLPLKEGFILTSNRDEVKSRQANFPKTYTSKSGVVSFPQDPKAGGTWIAGCKTKMICLLNGAIQKHKHNPPYKHSRGKVVLDAFDAKSFSDFREHYDFSNLEPHTLVMIDYENDIEIVELKWDGNQKHITKKNQNETHIWSSVTLYPDEIIKQREHWFTQWISKNSFTVASIKNFHKTGGNGDEKNDLVMQRNEELKTISVTSFEHQQKKTMMIYEDLIDNSITELYL